MLLRQLTLDAVVVEVQLLQVTVEQRNRSELVVGQLQVQQGGYVEHSLRNSFITQLVAVQPHKRQMNEVSEVVSEQEDEKNNCKYLDVTGYHACSVFMHMWSSAM